MAGIKFSGRIAGVAVLLCAFAASCAQILGEPGTKIERQVPAPPPETGIDPLLTPPPICEVGDTGCQGELLRTCIDGGSAWLVNGACKTAALCNALDSRCTEPACGVEQMSCDGESLLSCSKDRTGWEVFDKCVSKAHCDVTARQCLPAPCEPGQLRCNLGNLERCNDLRTDWTHLDTCETNELCEATRANAQAGVAPAGASTAGDNTADAGSLPGQPSATLRCDIHACTSGERRCAGNLLEECNEGLTGWELAEACDTPTLCTSSLTYAHTGERARCVRAKCAPDQHECTASGALEVCTEGRDGFRQVEQCTGPFCSSAEADAGREGCLLAPCQPGKMQCNGPQPQRCRADQTGFDPAGPACETRDLCNDDNPLNAFCEAPVCQRGAQSATEFRCQGATLQRCNDQHTGFDTFDDCDSAGLCNAGFGFQGCRPRVCNPGEKRCNGDFKQVCNDQLTDFSNDEKCAAGTCDQGECAMPCELGTKRCNNQGQVEECRDRLIGRVVTARCLSPQLCDNASGTCRPAPAGCDLDGQRRCRAQGATSVLEVCTDGRSRFNLLDTCAAGEFCDPNNVTCDVCNQNSQPACDQSNLVTCSSDGQAKTSNGCGQGCQEVIGQPAHCRTCVVGSRGTCSGAVLSTCVKNGVGESVRNNDCRTSARCEAELARCNADGDGSDCSCTPCNSGETGCNEAQPTVCNTGLTAFVSDGQAACVNPEHCSPTRSSARRCLECIGSEVRCVNGQIQLCQGTTFGPSGGSAQCIENNSVALVCPGGNAAPMRATCGPDQQCVAGIGCAACTPGQRRCRDGASEEICTANGVFAPASPCAGATNCRGPGQCGDATGCVAGPQLPAGSDCRETDGDPGVCAGLQCVDCLASRDCDDAVNCTDDVCDFGRATCSHQPNNGRCTNGLVCDGQETCDPNSTGTGCVPGQAPSCNRDSECANDACSEPGGCSITPNVGAICTAAGGASGTCSEAGVCLATCGNGRLDSPEECDSQGPTPACLPMTSGTATCNANCTVNRTQCVATCGNGTVDNGEDCDPQGPTPACLPMTSGTATCNANCTVNRSQCVADPFCGDGQVNADETCDPPGNPEVCADGTTATTCTPNCTIDQTACVAAQ